MKSVLNRLIRGQQLRKEDFDLYGRGSLTDSQSKATTFESRDDRPSAPIQQELVERRRQPIDPMLLLALREDVAILNHRISKVEGYLLAGFAATTGLQAGLNFFFS